MDRSLFRRLLALTCGLGLTLAGAGCSSQPAEPDTAEITPNPAPRAATPPAPAAAPEGVTSAPASPASPAPGEPRP